MILKTQVTTFEELKAYVKQERLTGKWYTFVGLSVEGRTIELKGYRTWLQIYQIDGVDFSNCMDVSVAQFEKDLAKPFESDNTFLDDHIKICTISKD